MWNVNEKEVKKPARGRKELIETLWNVNLFARAKQMAQGKELIETLWNVNKSKQKFKEEKF